MSTRPIVQVESVSKTYTGGDHNVTALDDVSFDLARGEFVSIIGPSGCGKSTLLAILGGLLPATAGQVLLDGEPVERPRPDRIGFVFQDHSLLPWRTAQKNIELGLEARGVKRQERRERTLEYLRLVGLEDAAQAYPAQLSGGMRQRVAIARSLALGCDILLLDEPFGALDEQTRFAMGRELERIHERTGGCVALVTHSISEAVFLSDRVIVMGPHVILDIIDVPVPRPRQHSYHRSSEFREIEQRLWDYLEPDADESRQDEE